MTKPTLKDIEDLMRHLVLPFYRIDRDIDLPGNNRRRETDAEHSWSLAFVACALAPEIDKKLDLGLIAQFAIAHDIIEVFAGDVSVWDQEKLPTKAANEAKAIAQIEEQFSHLPWIVGVIHAYEGLASPEAKFVYALDKLLPLMVRHIDQGKAYVDKRLTFQQFETGLASNRAKAQQHPAIGKYFNQLWKIFEENPNYFYEPKNDRK